MSRLSRERSAPADPTVCCLVNGSLNVDAVGSKENQFDPKLMRCLYDEGRRFAREAPKPWRTEPPLEGSVP